jgi:hypothetical protein
MQYGTVNSTIAALRFAMVLLFYFITFILVEDS